MADRRCMLCAVSPPYHLRSTRPNSLEAVCCWNEPVARAAARGASLVAALKAFILTEQWLSVMALVVRSHVPSSKRRGLRKWFPFLSRVAPQISDSTHSNIHTLTLSAHCILGCSRYIQDGGSSSISPYQRFLCLAFSGMHDGGNDERLLFLSQISAHPTLHAEKQYW